MINVPLELLHLSMLIAYKGGSINLTFTPGVA